MSTSKNPVPENGGNIAVAYGHDNKKFRLRTISAEKDVYSKLISKPVTKKISAAQIVLSVLVCLMQVITLSLVVGRYSYDSTASCGIGIWTSFVSLFAAIQTRWGLREPRYWKLHMSFALHIINCVVATFLIIMIFGGTVPYIRYKLGSTLYDNNSNRIDSYDAVSVPMLVTSLVLNASMGLCGLGQLFSSFVLTLMTGRAICCGMSKMHGKFFELELAGSEDKDGVVVYKKGTRNSQTNLENEVKSDIPPPYQEHQLV